MARRFDLVRSSSHSPFLMFSLFFPDARELCRNIFSREVSKEESLPRRDPEALPSELELFEDPSDRFYLKRERRSKHLALPP